MYRSRLSIFVKDKDTQRAWPVIYIQIQATTDLETLKFHKKHNKVDIMQQPRYVTGRTVYLKIKSLNIVITPCAKIVVWPRETILNTIPLGYAKLL